MSKSNYLENEVNYFKDIVSVNYNEQWIKQLFRVFIHVFFQFNINQTEFLVSDYIG